VPDKERQELRRQLVPGKDAQEQRLDLSALFVLKKLLIFRFSAN
jgi:hypothetical protein